MTISNSIVKKVITTTQGRYLLRLPNTEGPHPLLIGFHGYGENADVHLRQLERITGTAAWLVASVQALHWFYDRTHQHVVASWMTKLCREQAIVDNLRYIERVVTEILEHHDTNGRLVYEGFSQGAAMAYRAASAIRHRSDGLIVLAGDIRRNFGKLAVLTYRRHLSDEEYAMNGSHRSATTPICHFSRHAA